MSELVFILGVALVIGGIALGILLYPRYRSEAVLARLEALPPRMPVPVDDAEVRVVAGWLVSQAFEQTGVSVANDKVAYQRIVDAAHKAIEDLRTAESVTIALPYLTADENGPLHVEISLSRLALEELGKYVSDQ